MLLLHHNNNNNNKCTYKCIETAVDAFKVYTIGTYTTRGGVVESKTIKILKKKNSKKTPRARVQNRSSPWTHARIYILSEN